MISNFYPRPPRGGRQICIPASLPEYAFLSTPSARRATLRVIGQLAYLGRFLSTPSARRATQDFSPRLQSKEISIHALREEGDSIYPGKKSRRSDFYPRPPRGGRLWALSTSSPRSVFLSTPSARRATAIRWSRRTPRSYFYPRPPRGGRQPEGCSIRRALYISIHALREEGDFQ